MKVNFIDTNVLIRYLVEEPGTIPIKFEGVFSFFQKYLLREYTPLIKIWREMA